MSWTEERVETLKKMWADGQSASQIAKELGGVTRNAVIGKVHRLGLSNRAPESGSPLPEDGKFDDFSQIESAAAGSPPEPSEEMEEPQPAAPVQKTAVPARKAIVPAGQPLPPQPSTNEISPEALASQREVEKKARRLSLMELSERTCKWPIGDPATPDFWFCGLPVEQGKPYCEAHVGVAFQPMSSRRDRRR
ncbi:MAG: GcrA cell cycle regulator [Rhodobacteraceae bacterium]|nr:GcrA cell cycle regulator [Paracoccaceae bacterium]